MGIGRPRLVYNGFTIKELAILTGNTEACVDTQMRKGQCQWPRGGKTHGLTHTTLYKVWTNLKRRCTNPLDPGFDVNGGRGIRMYEAWLNDPKAFIDYVNSLGPCPGSGYQIGLINTNGDYAPGNLKWISRQVHYLRVRAAQYETLVLQGKYR